MDIEKVKKKKILTRNYVSWFWSINLVSWNHISIKLILINSKVLKSFFEDRNWQCKRYQLKCTHMSILDSFYLLDNCRTEVIKNRAREWGRISYE